MNERDIKGFMVDEAVIDYEDHIVLTYWFETQLAPLTAAAHLCQETSTAQWARPGMDEDFRSRHAAKILDVQIIEESKVSVFEGLSLNSGKFIRALVRVAHPHRNFGARLPNLLTMAMGEGAFFCKGIDAIKLLDIEFPKSYLASFDGPQFGAVGIRKILGIADRPLFFGVVKPNIGLDPEVFAAIAGEALCGGLDAAKDDEMLADSEYSPFDVRIRLIGETLRAAEDATGEKKIFIANITDEVDRIEELHDIAVEHGVGAVMVNAMAVGLSCVRMLRRFSSVPIIAHFDCIAPMSRHPYFGVSSVVMTKLERLAGCDAIIMPGFGARMKTPDDEVIANCEECIKPQGHLLTSLPVPGGSDWAGTLPLMIEKLRTFDFAIVPGRGVFNHPMGPRAGAMSLRQAWDAFAAKISIADHARSHPELAAAIKVFGELSQSAEDNVMTTTMSFTGTSLRIGRN